MSFGGRTERASIPAPLVNRLNDRFGGEENAQLFEQLFGEREVLLFGEGYGSGIQKAGKAYKPDGVDFILFDLMIGGNYQPRESVERCAASFGIGVVPIVGKGTLDEAVAFVKGNPRSQLGHRHGRCGLQAGTGAARSLRRARHLQDQVERFQGPVIIRIAKECENHG